MTGLSVRWRFMNRWRELAAAVENHTSIPVTRQAEPHSSLADKSLGPRPPSAASESNAAGGGRGPARGDRTADLIPARPLSGLQIPETSTAGFTDSALAPQPFLREFWPMVRSVVLLFLVASLGPRLFAATPVAVTPVNARHGMVVAAHPQAVAVGVDILKAGGNAMDAAIATSLAVGVAEPFGSGLGGKLMLLYFEAKTGKVYAVDGMDAAGSVNVPEYVQRAEEDRTYGYGAVCVPGLPAGLWLAHRNWGRLPWPKLVQPAITLAREGFRVLPKTRAGFAEQEKKLRRGDPDIARLYLPGGYLPEVGSLLPNADLARTLQAYAARGRDGFYRGAVALAIATAAQHGGGSLTLDDLANYEARIVEPMAMDFQGHTLLCAPPPTSGAALFLPLLKALEDQPFTAPLRTAVNLDLIGRVWRVVSPMTSRAIGDMEQSRFLFEKLIAPDSIAEIRSKVFGLPEPQRVQKVGSWLLPSLARPSDAAAPVAEESPFFESYQAATTHFIIADKDGNVVCATQSQSLHFGAGVVPPGTGVVMNNSMSNFSFTDPKGINYVAPGKRSRSTISPTIVLRDRKPSFAIGLPGAARIPTAMLQILLDRLVLGRPLAEAIGDTRFHYAAAIRRDDVEAFEAEQSFPHAESLLLQERGWKVNLPEPAGTGRYFGGVNAIEFNADGTLTGFADPRRTNVAAGY